MSEDAPDLGEINLLKSTSVNQAEQVHKLELEGLEKMLDGIQELLEETTDKNPIKNTNDFSGVKNIAVGDLENISEVTLTKGKRNKLGHLLNTPMFQAIFQLEEDILLLIKFTTDAIL
jgi:hypothetical protein